MVAERGDYEEFLRNVKRTRLTRAGLVKIMRENEQREAEKKARLQQAQDEEKSSGTNRDEDAL